MTDWHDVELFALPHAVRAEYYIKLLSNWEDWVDLEHDRLLTVPTPQPLALYFNVPFEDDGSAQVILQVTITVYVVIAVIRLLVAAQDDTVDVACLDLSMSENGCGVFVPLLSGIRHDVEDIGFL